MAGFDLIVSGGTVVWGSGRQRLDVGVRGGRIVALGEDLGRDAERVVEAGGCYVLPGAIDAHVHPIHAETMGTVSEAAAFGGVTTLLHYIYLKGETGVVDGLRAAQEDGAATSLVDFGLHGTVTDVPRRIREFPDAFKMGVGSYKFFMAYEKRGMLTRDRDLLSAMEMLSALGALPCVHAENGDMADWLEDDYRREGRTTAMDYPETRPTSVEAEAVHRALALARMAGSPLYLVHISCAEALGEVVQARGRGQRGVFAETCPHYLTLTGDEVMPVFGARAKIAPPLRDGGDVETLWLGITNRWIEVVGSDHSAFDPSEKTAPGDNIFDVGFGAPGVESMLTVLHEEGVNRGRMGLERLVELVSEAPARIFGLQGKGRVMPGADADMVIFDPVRGEAAHRRRSPRQGLLLAVQRAPRNRACPGR